MVVNFNDPGLVRYLLRADVDCFRGRGNVKCLPLEYFYRPAMGMTLPLGQVGPTENQSSLTQPIQVRASDHQILLSNRFEPLVTEQID